MTGREIYEFIKPHLGSISASGMHDLDTLRLNNFEIYDELINCLLEDIEECIYYSQGRYERSILEINAKAKEVLLEKLARLKDYCSDLD